MKTRNADSPISATTAKKTPPSKKSASKPPPNSTEPAPGSAATPKSTETKRSASATKAKQVKTNETASSESMPEPAVVDAKASADAAQVTPEAKAVSGTKTTRTVVKKRIVVRRKTPTSAKVGSSKTPKSGEAGKEKVEGSTKKEEVEIVQDVESTKKELFLENADESAEKEEPTVENVEGSTKVVHNVANAEEYTKKVEVPSDAEPLIENIGNYLKQDDPALADVKSLENQEPSLEKEEEDETKIIEDIVGPKNESVNMEKEESKGDVHPKEDVQFGDEKMEECGGQEEEVDALEEERAELTALAQERKIKKELEIFIGGLDRDAMEEDVKKAFENVGEVVEVRLHKNPSTNKNKGYAFVKFATKEQASRALSEMKNPVICGKRCGTAPSEDNDTLFLGNICNTWTKEAIKHKLKDYGIEGVENITLVADPQHEGLSRGFAFLEFSRHSDAMIAYKRLQKHDVIFGHTERTAKVAFAEPLREPDPEVMAQVKSIFVDGLPPHWDEDRVREIFKGYGEIDRIMLARNMSTAKRKDFGFVDFATHEAAVACIDDINSRELGDGNSKAKVKARLSNPLPKTQAVKGGMCGGFRIGHGSGGTFPKFGRGFGRGGHPFNRPNFQRGRGFYQHGRGQTGRVFANEHNLDSPYPPFRGRQNFGQGGRWDYFSGAHQASAGGTVPARFNHDRPRHGGATDRSRGRHMPLRGQPFPPEEEFNRPFAGRHFDDPYFYDDSPRGIKRPSFTDQDLDYMEPSRVRPRLDYSDPAVSLRGTHYRDTFGAGSSRYSHDYYGSDYDGGSYSSYYGGDRPYGGGYYY